MANALVVFSGGQDSTTCLGWAINHFDLVKTITFDYGQRHAIEIEQAQKITDKLGVSNVIFSINAFEQLSDSALINKAEDIAAGHSHKPDLPASYVPNRNALMLTIAHAYAQKTGFKNIVTGVCQTDYSGYPDCREDFIKSLEQSLNLGSESDIRILTPLMYLTKAQTFALAEEEKILDTVLEMSHTCYNGLRETRHAWGYGCGECPACQLRANGWQEYLESKQ